MGAAARDSEGMPPRPSCAPGRSRRGTYCLYCYAPMPSPVEAAVRGPSRPCGACGAVNLRADQRLYWTREPWLVHLEGWAKAATVTSLVALAWAMGQRSPGGGSGQGWILGFPIVAGAVLWQTVEKITRWKPYFRATTFWTLVPLALGGLVLAVALVDLTGRHSVDSTALLAVAGALALALLLSLAARRTCRALGRWRDRRIAWGAGGEPDGPAHASTGD